jgi:oligopeptidase B
MPFERNGRRKNKRTSSLIVFSLLCTVALSTAWTAARSQSDGVSLTPAGTAEPTPPVAKRAPKILHEHGHERIDDYPWFRDRNDPDTLAYLQAENVYAAHRLARLSPLIENIARELRERADGANDNLEFVDPDYIYERRFLASARHPTIVRRPAAGGPEETVLDIEQLAAGHENYSLDDYVVSPDGKTVAFAVDTLGDLRYRILLRHIPT